MQSVLMEKLWAYIVRDHPDLMVRLQEQLSVTAYLETKIMGVMPMADRLLSEGKPVYIIEDLCMDALTADLKPSRYQYIRSVLEEEFPQEYERLKESGTLTYEVMNLIEVCKDIFSDFDFNSENEANRHLRYAIIGQVHDYLH